MMKTAKISIIIPIYQAEKRINTLLQCLKNQTYRDFEALLIDDGSTDGSLSICENETKTDNRFAAFHQENKGVASARNYGLKEAKGEFITFLDADDEIPDDYLEKLFEAIQSSDADIAICDVAVITDDLETRRFSCTEVLLSRIHALNYLLCRESINSGPCAKLFRRSIIADSMFPNLKAYEDIVFVVEVFDRANRIASTTATEYKYIQNQEGAMSGFLIAPNKDVLTATEWLIDYIKCYDELSPKCYYVTLSHLLQYVQIVAKTEEESGVRFIKAARKIFRKNICGILMSPAFSAKEKLYFLSVAFGFLL